jgi:hypothetical protein
MLTKLRKTTEIAETRSGAPELLPRFDRLVDLRFFDISPKKLAGQAAICVPDPNQAQD